MSRLKVVMTTVAMEAVDITPVSKETVSIITVTTETRVCQKNRLFFTRYKEKNWLPDTS